MPTAREIASRLAYEFLRMGRYSAASGPVEVPSLAVAVAAADDGNVPPALPVTAGFEGLAVQSIGHEEGTDQPKVHIYLTKGSSRLIKALPKDAAGIPVAVHKMGAINVRPDAAGAATNQGNVFERGNRICCGSSCAPTSEQCAGTLGALVRRAGLQQLFLLSNNHVLAGCNHVPQNQPILSPSSMDGGPNKRAPGEIGRHALIHELRSGDPNFVNPCDSDLALAKATKPAILSSWQGDGQGYDTPTIGQPPQSLLRVKKYGRTTGLTLGEVEACVATPMPVTYNSKHFKGVIWFKDVWTVRADAGQPFALPGDSGSLVVTEDAAHAVGLVFAANSTGEYAWIVPISCVLAAFGGLQLVGNHGV